MLQKKKETSGSKQIRIDLEEVKKQDNIDINENLKETEDAFSEEAFEEEAFGGEAFEEKMPGQIAFGDGAFEEKMPGQIAFGDGAFEEKMPGQIPFEEGAFSDKAFEEKISDETFSRESKKEKKARDQKAGKKASGPGKNHIKDAAYQETKKKKKGLGLVKGCVSLLLLLVLAVGATFGYSLYKEYADHTSEEGKEIEFVIPQGSSSKAIANMLQEDGLIRYTQIFLLKLSASEYEGKLRAGTFQLHEGMCIDDIIKTLATASGVAAEDLFTVPEGFSVEMIAAKLEKEDIMAAEEFLDAVKAAAKDWRYASQLPDQKDVFYQMQGYLYPDTYAISKDISGKELVQMMLDEFLSKFDEERQEEAKALDMTVEEVVLRASLLQKETEVPIDYPMIAGVINNRLSQGMRLQFDSTVIYAMTEGLYGVSRVMNKDLKYDSPYNTYQVDGLPIGPICNPSIEAIDGVLHAKEHTYLYFQTDPDKEDGSNAYFETYEEHMAAYKKSKAKREAKEEEVTIDIENTAEKTKENTTGKTED